MTNLGIEIDSDSSDDEWVISSTLQSPKPAAKNLPGSKKDKRLTIGAAAIRTIKANLPATTLPPPKRNKTTIKNLDTPTSSAPSTPPLFASVSTPSPVSLQYISDEELVTICTDMNTQLLVSRLVQVYRSCEIYSRIREIETSNSVIEVRLKDHLHLCFNPCDFIIDTLMEISTYFVDNSRNTELTTKFRRLLVGCVCSALRKFLDTPLDKRRLPVVEKDLISFDEEPIKNDEPADLISFDDIVIDPQQEDEEDEEDDDDEEEVEITLSEILGIPADIIDRYTLTHDHQLRLLKMIDTIPAPVVIYYAIDTFKLAPLLSLGGEAENDGVKLCRSLMKHGYYDEAVAAIRKLDIFKYFPVDATADQFFTAGHGMYLPALYNEKPELQKQLLAFINKQLRFNYAGNLNVVPQEYFVDLADGTDQTPQLSRLKERKFQKDLVSCAAKVMKDLNIDPDDEYYFISLSQRYARLRFILAQRAIQQLEDDDYSIEASSNFNGLIDLVCEDDPVLARLAIKELIDIGDTIAPPYFASLYKQQEFYCRYNALPLSQRLLGVVKGEQLSRHRSTFVRKKPAKPQLEKHYELPPNTKRIIVDSRATLMQMKEVLSISNICGLDTEWVPGFAKLDDVKTALMQIATDIEGCVFLLDLKTMYKDPQLYLLTEVILKLLFEDEAITKLAFDFSGDLDLLNISVPSSRGWQIKNFVDFKALKKLDGSSITGGLAGVVSSFLGVSLNKRQQLSNWEKRPLTEEQVIYGACDACCLLDVYYILCKRNHPFVENLPKFFKKGDEHSNNTIKSLDN